MAQAGNGAALLRSYMKRERLTCRAVAAQTGLSHGHVAYICRTGRMGVAAARALSPVLRVRWDKLVTGGWAPGRTGHA